MRADTRSTTALRAAYFGFRQSVHYADRTFSSVRTDVARKVHRYGLALNGGVSSTVETSLGPSGGLGYRQQHRTARLLAQTASC